MPLLLVFKARPLRKDTRDTILLLLVRLAVVSWWAGGLVGWVICMNSQTGAGGMVILIAIKKTRLKASRSNQGNEYSNRTGQETET